MFDFLLANVKPEATVPLDSLLEKFTVGGGVFVRGMCTVFAVLAIIWLFLSVVRYFVYDLPNKRKADATEEPKKQEAAAPAPAVAAPVVTPTAAPADEELVAVIAAAIAAATAEAGGGKFRVVSFHRVKK
jgi:Na+-transporting methylmalonyl-CoA/oxaloacetate decarboxylase gamma subunit